MKIFNPEQAVIPFEKLEGYSLNPNHPEGKHKALVFQSALGINLDNANDLRIELKEVLKEKEAIATSLSQYGQKYQLDFEMTRNQKTAVVRSIWIVRSGESFPRLITCYIL